MSTNLIEMRRVKQACVRSIIKCFQFLTTFIEARAPDAYRKSHHYGEERQTV